MYLIYIYIYFLIYYSNPLKKDRTVEHLEVVSYLSLFLSFGDPKWRRNETVCPGWWLWGILLLDHCTHLPNLFGIVGTIVHQHICSPNYLGGIYYINYKTKHGCSSNICHSLRFITFMISSVQPQQIKDWHYDICIYNYLYLEGEGEREILWYCENAVWAPIRSFLCFWAPRRCALCSNGAVYVPWTGHRMDGIRWPWHWKSGPGSASQLPSGDLT